MGGYAGNLISFDDRREDGAWLQAGTIADGPVHGEPRVIGRFGTRDISGRITPTGTIPCFPEIDIKARGGKHQGGLRPIVKFTAHE